MTATYSNHLSKQKVFILFLIWENCYKTQLYYGAIFVTHFGSKIRSNMISHANQSSSITKCLFTSFPSHSIIACLSESDPISLTKQLFLSKFHLYSSINLFCFFRFSHSVFALNFSCLPSPEYHPFFVPCIFDPAPRPFLFVAKSVCFLAYT